HPAEETHTGAGRRTQGEEDGRLPRVKTHDPVAVGSSLFDQGEEDGAHGVSRVGDGTEGFPRQKNGPGSLKVLRSFYAKFTVFFRVRPGLVPAETFDPTFVHLQQPC